MPFIYSYAFQLFAFICSPFSRKATWKELSSCLHLTSHSFLHPFQLAFYPICPPETILVKVTNDFRIVKNDGRVLVLVSLDL
jgi:hypothetical protein